MEELEDATVIVKGVDLTIEREMRLVVRGANGAGKSTLIKALAGALPLVGGERIEDDRLALGYFRQDLSQELDQTKTALELVVETARRDGDGMTSEQRGREVLGALGLKGEMALRKVGSLSGGEKARVALGCFVLTPSNVLVLDEPSNHLDVDTVAALAGGLNSFEGAIVVISHDRAFVDELQPTHVLTVNDGAATLEKRELVNADWDVSSIDERGAIEVEEEPVDQAPVVIVEEDAATRKKRLNAPRRMAKLEALISEADEAIAAVDADMVAAGADVGKAVDLQKRRDVLQADLDKLWAEYNELDTLLVAA
jgi:ATPase subunit of ABC transporter with duplicated ATPase domains